MRTDFVTKALVCALLALVAAACTRSSSPPPSARVEEDESASGSDSAASTAPLAEPGEEPELKDLEPFDPPPLAELDAKAEWEDQPVLDSVQLLRERQKDEPLLASVEQALKLKNTGSDANNKILSALGRLPENDAAVNWDATMNRHLPIDIKSTNPIMLNSTVEFDVSGLISYGLFGFDWNMNPFAVKDTVKRWQTSKDRLYDKVEMRSDVTWSDGRPITAHDVVFSFQTIMNPKVPVPAVRSGTDKLRWVHAYDDYTLVFFHRESLATNVWNVNFPVLPKHIYEKSLHEDYTLQNSPYHVGLENKPVVGGPYTIAKRVRAQEVVLQRRESWYMHERKQVRDKPYFKQIRFRIVEDPNTALLALKSAQIDDLELKAEQWVSQTNSEDFYEHNTKVTGTEWTYFYFGWNNKSPLFQDRRVREAMSYAFDYDEMLDKLLYGLNEQAVGIFHPEGWMAPSPPSKKYRQDLDRAEELLDEAGWEDHDGDGIRDKQIGDRSIPFEFSILVRQDPERLRICELLKFNLSQIGINCNIGPLEATVLQQRMLDKEFQAYFGGWGSGADPDTSENVWKTGEGRNFLSYSNKRVDELFKQGRLEFDREKRAKIYGEIDKIIFQDQPCTFLYYRNAFFGFNNGLRGYNFSPRGPYHYGPGFGSLWKAAADN